MQGSMLSGALSLALCCTSLSDFIPLLVTLSSSADINRITKEVPDIKPRILNFTVSADVSSQYIPVMNCIFSAQKKVSSLLLLFCPLYSTFLFVQAIPVDTCILSQMDSSFLQQASHITGGVYLKPPLQEGLLQYLLVCFFVPL